MTCFEKLKLEHPNNVSARFAGGARGCPSDYGYMPNPPTKDALCTLSCDECWNREINDTESGTSSTVNHPQHYIREGGMECIDEMILVFGIEATMSFCLLNAWKYRYRAAGKGGEEDLKKSDWYMSKYAELKEGADRVPQ